MSVVRTVAPAILVSGIALASVAFSFQAAADERVATSVDQARVVAVNPVYRLVDYSVPTEQCRLVDVPMAQEPRHSGYRSYTGPILGAILGGAIGNAVGHGKTNKKVGTAVGAVLGGTIGRDIQRRHTASRYRNVGYQTEEVCETVIERVEREELSGYDVTYRYAGQNHTARLDYDPGKYLDVRVQVTPV